MQKLKRPSRPNRVRFEIALDKITDKDIILKLVGEPNKSEYVRQLIRDDMKKKSA